MLLIHDADAQRVLDYLANTPHKFSEVANLIQMLSSLKPPDVEAQSPVTDIALVKKAADGAGSK